jgi:uncharacterized protein (DUF1499 family)
MADLRKLRALAVRGNDMKILDKKLLWLAPLGAVGLAAGVLAALHPGLEAQTSADNPDPKLRSRFYNADLDTVRELVLDTIPQLNSYGAHWRLAAEKSDGNIAAEVPVLMFVDDVVITLHQLENGVRVDVHSQSRFPGKSDLGENRRHVLQLLSALDKKLDAES